MHHFVYQLWQTFFGSGLKSKMKICIYDYQVKFLNWVTNKTKIILYLIFLSINVMIEFNEIFDQWDLRIKTK